jgi:hypothetical protein
MTVGRVINPALVMQLIKKKSENGRVLRWVIYKALINRGKCVV